MKTRFTKTIFICLVIAMAVSGWICKQCFAQEDSIKDALVLSLSFDSIDEISGQKIIVDESGYENHGTLLSGKIVPGKIGNAFYCQAINKADGIRIKDNDSLDLDAVTIAVWIKTDQLDGQWNRILDKSWRTGYNLCIGGDYEGKTFRNQVSFETAMNCTPSKSHVVDGQWHFIVATYDGQTSRIYIDGKLDCEITHKKPKPMEHNDVDIMIGRLAVPEPNPHEHAFFDGLIDEVRVFNRVLTDKEVQMIYWPKPKK